MKLGMSSAEETLLSSLEKENEKISNSYLRKVLKKDLKLSQFKGVFPCDRLRKPREGESIILNTDPHYLQGRHFVALNRKKGRYIYFDSLAKEIDGGEFPELYEELRRRKMLPIVPVLQTPIQSPTSNFCGLFCLDYVLSLYSPFNEAKSRKYKLHNKKLLENDKICAQNVVDKLLRKK